MIYDLTANVLERAIKSLLDPVAEVIVAQDGITIPDAYVGYIVQVRHTANTAMTNDGRMPVISTYEAEVTRHTFADGITARQEDSGATIALRFAEMQSSVNAVLESGLSLNIINVALTQEELATTETEAHLFSSVYEITCQPLLIEED